MSCHDPSDEVLLVDPPHVHGLMGTKCPHARKLLPLDLLMDLHEVLLSRCIDDGVLAASCPLLGGCRDDWP